MKIETEHGDGERFDGAEDGDMDRPNGNGVGNCGWMQTLWDGELGTYLI